MKPKRARTLPALATTIPSLLGPVTVTRKASLRETETGTECLGIWRSQERTVQIETGASLTTAWHTYWHEWVHVALYDSGINLDKAVEEQVCDVLATARVREMLDNRR